MASRVRIRRDPQASNVTRRQPVKVERRQPETKPKPQGIRRVLTDNNKAPCCQALRRGGSATSRVLSPTVRSSPWFEAMEL